ncbi:hypothetical protein ACHAPU_004949 [Fusarium lateritium]
MANMNPMGGPVGGAPMPMMNNGAMNPQAAAAAAAASRQHQANDNQRSVLNTYIYEYFIRMGMYDCARSLLSSDQQVNVLKDGANRRRDENGNLINGVGEDSMDTDSKDDIDSKLPEDLPPPKLPMPASDTSFLYEWFSVFWDIYYAQRAKSGNNTINQYVQHTQQQSRLKQNQQQELLRQMRPDMSQQQQYQMMRNMQNGGMAMNMKQGNLARAAMANNQNPQMMLQQAKQNQMQRDPSGMDGQNRPTSPSSGDNAPSPSKRQRIEGAPFNPNQPGAMMPNGRPGQGMPGQQMPGGPNTAAAQQILTANGINPHSLHPQQLQNFANAPPAAQQKSIATYSQNLQQHHGTQMGGKQMPNVPQGQGSPMMAQGPDGTALNAFYNPGEMGGPGGIRPGPGGPQNGGGSNHALQDYQMQLMLLEQQNKKRLMMARQEQDTVGNGMPREGQPGGPPGPNGQFPDTSPQAMRPGASPNPSEQMKRGTPQMNNSGIPSPVPEGGQSRGSPNPAMNFMGNQMDPNMAPHFFKGMEGNMGGQPPMNGGMRPPSSHPGQPFNGQMTPQMMAARQQQQQQQGQPGQGPQGNPQQWQQGPNGQMIPQQMQQQSPQIQGTPQQRSMPPPQAPPAGPNGANRTTASPQQAAAAPPTPSQTNKAAPKKKESKAAKDKRAAANKKANQNLNNAGATPSNDNNDSQDTPAPATPIQNANAANFNKNGGNAAAATAPPPAPPAPQHDPNQMMGMDNSFGPLFDGGGMELANPLNSGDVLNDFDFDSFLHDQDGDNSAFNFTEAFPMGDEIGAD